MRARKPKVYLRPEIQARIDDGIMEIKAQFALEKVDWQIYTYDDFLKEIGKWKCLDIMSSEIGKSPRLVPNRFL